MQGTFSGRSWTAPAGPGCPKIWEEGTILSFMEMAFALSRLLCTDLPRNVVLDAGGERAVMGWLVPRKGPRLLPGQSHGPRLAFLEGLADSRCIRGLLNGLTEMASAPDLLCNISHPSSAHSSGMPHTCPT